MQTERATSFQLVFAGHLAPLNTHLFLLSIARYCMVCGGLDDCLP